MNRKSILWVFGPGHRNVLQSYAALIMYLQFVLQSSVIIPVLLYSVKRGQANRFRDLERKAGFDVASGMNAVLQAVQTELTLKPDFLSECLQALTTAALSSSIPLVRMQWINLCGRFTSMCKNFTLKCNFSTVYISTLSHKCKSCKKKGGNSFFNVKQHP